MAITKPKKETKPKKPTTLKEYVDQGWKVGPTIQMSDPPVYTLTKDGKTIKFRPPMKNPFGKRPIPEIPPKRKTPKDLLPPKGKRGISGLKGLGKKGAEALREYLKKNPIKKKDGGFPDLSGDGKITKKDILMGRGVIKKKKGGPVDRPKKKKKKKMGLLGIGIEIIKPKPISAADGGEVNGLKKMGMKAGGLAGRLARRGYGKARR
jgi:hypothetical protein